MANSADPDQLASSSWLLKKPTDLDLHCLQRQGISGINRTRVKIVNVFYHPVKAQNLNFSVYIYILYYQFIISPFFTFKFAWFPNIWN